MSHEESGVGINISEDTFEPEDTLDQGHGHNHSHGHGGNHDHSKCGHSHSKKKQDLGHKWLNTHGIEIKAFIYSMTFMVWFFCLFVIDGPLKEYEFNKWANDIFMTFTASLAAISYYKCTNTKSSNPTKTLPVYAGPQNNNQCKNCNFWKPERTHHCRACNECILRMDHHCPWIVNCVGYRNHKSFVLFCSYIGIGGIYYVYRSIYYLTISLADESFYDFNILFLIFWVVFTIVVGFIAIMVFGLSLYHTSLAMNNLTTLESMGGANMKMPCETQSSLDKKYTNQFDKGMLANLYEFFGSTYFLFWYPTVPETSYTGQSYEKIGMANPTEVLEFLREKNGTPGESEEERIMKPRSLAEVDLVNIFKIAEDFTKDKHMQFFDKMLEVGKRKDNTYVAPKQPVIHGNPFEQQIIQDIPLEKEVSKDSNNEIGNVEVIKSETEEQDKEDVTVVSESASNDPKAE